MQPKEYASEFLAQCNGQRLSCGRSIIFSRAEIQFPVAAAAAPLVLVSGPAMREAKNPSICTTFIARPPLQSLNPSAGRCRQRFAIPSGVLPEESHREGHGFQRPSSKTGIRSLIRSWYCGIVRQNPHSERCCRGWLPKSHRCSMPTSESRTRTQRKH
jgi:hypothetical protein